MGLRRATAKKALPPYNEELRSIHATLEGRLHNLRHWRDLDGEPMNVPLLARPIDPQTLQRSAKGYLNKLKLTSHRLQDASEKEGQSQMEEFRMDADIDKSGRAIGLQHFAIDAAERNVAIKSVNVTTSTKALANYVAKTLIKQFGATSDAIAAARSRLQQSRILIGAVSAQISGALKSTIPNTFGFSNGGQNLEQADVVWSVRS